MSGTWRMYMAHVPAAEEGEEEEEEEEFICIHRRL